MNTIKPFNVDEMRTKASERIHKMFKGDESAARNTEIKCLTVCFPMEIHPLTKHKDSPYIRQRNPRFICDSAQIIASF